ncbi:hypothetical protein ACTA71_000171 [Dictyostelium dimigraforme]
MTDKKDKTRKENNNGRDLIEKQQSDNLIQENGKEDQLDIPLTQSLNNGKNNLAASLSSPLFSNNGNGCKNRKLSSSQPVTNCSNNSAGSRLLDCIESFANKKRKSSDDDHSEKDKEKKKKKKEKEKEDEELNGDEEEREEEKDYEEEEVEEEEVEDEDEDEDEELNGDQDQIEDYTEGQVFSKIVWDYPKTHTFLKLVLKHMKNPDANSTSNKSYINAATKEFNKQYKVKVSIDQALTYLNNLKGVNSKIKKDYSRPKIFTKKYKEQFKDEKTWKEELDSREDFHIECQTLLKQIEELIMKTQILANSEARDSSSQINDRISTAQQEKANIRKDRYRNLVGVFTDEKTFRGRVVARLLAQEKNEEERLTYQIDQDTIKNNNELQLIQQLSLSNQILEKLSNKLDILTFIYLKQSTKCGNGNSTIEPYFNNHQTTIELVKWFIVILKNQLLVEIVDSAFNPNSSFEIFIEDVLVANYYKFLNQQQLVMMVSHKDNGGGMIIKAKIKVSG